MRIRGFSALRKSAGDESSSLAGWARTPAGAAILATYAVTRILLVGFHVHYTTDLRIYHDWLTDVARGLRPFVDFPVEYPPLAWWFIQLPAHADRLTYYFRFRAMTAGLEMVAFALLLWVASRRQPRRLSFVAGGYVVATTVLENVLFDRLDLGVLLILVSALAALVVADASRTPSRWRLVAYAAIGVGTAFKVFPIILVPFLLLADWREHERPAAVALHVGAFLALAALPTVAGFVVYGPEVLGFLAYHTARGLEFGSTWASVLWVLSFGGPAIQMAVRYGCWESTGRGELALVRIASLAAPVVLGGFFVWAVALGRRFTSRRAVLHAMLALSAFVLVSKVLSPQYLVWVVPLLSLAAAELFPTRSQLCVFGILLIGACALTTLVWPLGMRDVGLAAPWTLATIGARNALLWTVVVWVTWQAAVRDLAEARVPAPVPSPITGVSAGTPPVA